MSIKKRFLKNSIANVYNSVGIMSEHALNLVKITKIGLIKKNTSKSI